MKTLKFAKRQYGCILVSLIALTLLNGCATFGEKDLRSFNKDYDQNLPTSPKYIVKYKTQTTYNIVIHQGAPLFNTPGYVRAGYLSQAGRIIAEDKCTKQGLELERFEVDQVGDSGWVHIIGAFSCRSIAISQPEPIIKQPEPKVTQPEPIPKYPEPKAQPTEFKTGTGFFISKDGYLLTAYHVVEGTKIIKILQDSGEEYPAKIIRVDAANDIALLKVAIKVQPI